MEKNYEKEIKEGFTPRQVMEEASRCLLCLDAPCSKACPALTDPARFIRAVRFKNFEGAAEVIRENNPLGSICARVCPTEKYCEKACSRSGIDMPIDIARIQRFVTDFETQTKMKVLKALPSNGKKIAVIGSGPAGLSCAQQLCLKGFAVDIYDRYRKAGGYLRYGIPEYRLPQGIVDIEVKRITDLGVKILTNEVVDKVRLEELKKTYDAVVMATGLGKGKVLPMFEGSRKVIDAVSWLKKVKEKKGNITVPENVLVIGGGDVAMDVCSTLKVLGAKNVSDVVYEELHEFRASRDELKLARDLNVSIIDGYVPTEFKKNGTTIFRHRVINSEIKIKADLVILAVGQEMENPFELKCAKNEVDMPNYRVDKTNLFFAGDIAHGDKTVVYSVKTGKEVALEVSKYLGGK
jgi:dihydropyrimidine dehydrogenase (NAD+) subunit PreT